jgi:type II secretory ATPase GspE/PulE/Tfp pilus assembly ATPase PilB-like protein
MDIGVEPYLITPSLLCVVGQRLIRRLCPDCKEAYEPSTKELGGIKLKADLIYRPKGCQRCNQIGYRGRCSIAEVMVINDQIRVLVNQRASFLKIREVARASGMQTLFEIAMQKVQDGVTSLEEALSFTFEE